MWKPNDRTYGTSRAARPRPRARVRAFRLSDARELTSSHEQERCDERYRFPRAHAPALVREVAISTARARPRERSAPRERSRAFHWMDDDD